MIHDFRLTTHPPGGIVLYMNTDTEWAAIHAENIEKFQKELEEIIEEFPPLDALVADHILVAIAERPEERLGPLVRQEVEKIRRCLEDDILTGLIHLLDNLHTKEAP